MTAISTRDRLYQLLPGIHRLREAEAAERTGKGEAGYYLRDFLRVIGEQLDELDENLAQLYDDWFIETAADWAVPYIADLIGYQAVSAAGHPELSSAEDHRVLVPRLEVADTLRLRRRRGSASVVPELARATAGWPTLAVEYYRLLGWTQHLNHLQLCGQRARSVSLRDANVLDQVGGPFDPFARSVDVRRISNDGSQGRFNIPSIGALVWRLKVYGVTETPANCLDAGKNAYTFSVLGNDTPLYTRAQATQPMAAAELTLPTPIRRRALHAAKDDYYGADKSFAIWADWAGHDASKPIPASAIQVANLADWAYEPPDDKIAVDPELGRIAFPPRQLPERHVKVTYHYAFSADVGGGEYDRVLSAPADAKLYTVGTGGTHKRIRDALHDFHREAPKHAVIEVQDSGVYVEQLEISLAAGQTLQLRAANWTRPVLRLLDWQTDRPDALAVKLAHGSHFTLDGFVVTGRGLCISPLEPMTPTRERNAIIDRHENPRNQVCPTELTIRHCTLVPGWTLDCDCQPITPNKESIELRNVRAKVTIEHSILGPIEVRQDEVQTDPIPLLISDSVIDAMDGEREAIVGPTQRHAHATLWVRRSTIFGVVQVHALQLAENSIFNDCVHVARRQIGCMRFCYVPAGCRTPRRYSCQPDLSIAAVRGELKGKPQAEVTAAVERVIAAVRPHFTSRHYGTAAYCQLASKVSPAIAAGADDESEMGVFHHLYQPQRLANLRARLSQYTPAGMEAGVVVIN
ncbi:MAG TPA: hypothetical protein VFN67_15000 [Polyangiales bacterium]|nr:hypothetical protein [Polyangiales bacterium]